MNSRFRGFWTASEARLARHRFVLWASMLGLLVQGVLVAPSHSACECGCETSYGFVWAHPDSEIYDYNATIYPYAKQAKAICSGSGSSKTPEAWFIGGSWALIAQMYGTTYECGCYIGNLWFRYPDTVDDNDIIEDESTYAIVTRFYCTNPTPPGCSCESEQAGSLFECP